MKPSELHTVWAMPDNTRLTAKQFSLRLPVHVAAKLAAFGELYPNKTRTQLIADLLATAIESAAEGLPTVKGQHLHHVVADDGTHLEVFEDVGMRAKFKKLANRHYAELEKELGNKEPGKAYDFNYKSASAEGGVEAFTVAEESTEEPGQ